jgi:ferrous iron transport protein A
MASELKPLASLPAGTSAIVREVNLAPDFHQRLMELGILTGTRIEVVRFAPLGGPVEIRVRGYNLTLRKHEAEQVLVSLA